MSWASTASRRSPNQCRGPDCCHTALLYQLLVKERMCAVIHTSLPAWMSVSARALTSLTMHDGRRGGGGGTSWTMEVQGCPPSRDVTALVSACVQHPLPCGGEKPHRRGAGCCVAHSADQCQMPFRAMHGMSFRAGDATCDKGTNRAPSLHCKAAGDRLAIVSIELPTDCCTGRRALKPSRRG
jgi:hypothetical protein